MKTIQTLNEFLSESNDPVFEKAGKPLDFVEAAKVFNDKIKSLGIKCRPLTPGDLESADSNKNNDKVVEVDKIKIDTKKLGAFGPVFKTAGLIVNAVYGETNQAMIMILEYQWEHPSGSNGYRIRDSYWDGKWVGY